MQTCMKIFSGLNLLILASAKRMPRGIENSHVKKKINSVVPNPPMICCTISIKPICSSSSCYLKNNTIKKYE